MSAGMNDGLDEMTQSTPLPRGQIELTGDGILTLTLDLGMDEVRRRTEIMRAFGPDWDPIAMLQGEDEAYERLYSGLDHEQRNVYERLVQAGVLTPRGRESDAA